MSEAAGCIFELQHAEAAVTVIHTQNPDSLDAEFCVDMTGERVPLNAIVLNDGEVPGNAGLGNSGIGGGAVHDRRLGLESEAQRDVGSLGADGSEDRPNFVVIDQPNGFVRGSAPDFRVLGNAAGRDVVLPVVVVVAG